MFAGHLGIALAAARVEPRVNLGVYAAAALWLDLVLWAFILLGLESVDIPADFARTHQPRFVFPWSHGLAASVLWSLLGALAVAACWRARPGGGARAACIAAAVVFSHWILDAVVHRPELPVAGAASAQVGLGLWDAMAAALALEAALVVAGLVLFLRRCALPRARALALAALVVLVLAFTIVGMTVAPPPPSATAMAASSLVTIAITCLLMAWLGRGAGAPRA